MLKLTDLALRPDIRLGPMLVSPARRLIEGPGGYVHVEPLIMQVFLLLLDGAGKVVTRNELFDRCWGGVYVGDDSLNRAIAKVRRVGGQVAPGVFEIETIPRTGYRLTGEILASLERADQLSARGTGLTRRQASGAALGVAALAGIGAWTVVKSREDRRFGALLQVGAEATRNSGEFDLAKSRRALEEAVRMRPDSARAWGCSPSRTVRSSRASTLQRLPANVRIRRRRRERRWQSTLKSRTRFLPCSSSRAELSTGSRGTRGSARSSRSIPRMFTR
jgi:DNA-binding winged helix-turn-helix (wHTH) protein